jgi:transglutaminase-like putative cysteine protease
VRLQVTHRTLLTYEQPIAETYMELRMHPREGAGQALESFRLDVRPESDVRSYRDGFGNLVHYFNHVAPHDRVEVTGHSVVATQADVPDLEDTLFPEDFLQFREPVNDVPGVRAIAHRIEENDLEDRLDRLTEHINQEFEYRPQTTDVFTAVEEVLRRRVGVCQDFAHLFIAAARAMGIPARYVSGYIYSGVGNVGTGASHAWAEALVPGRGWVGHDPTNPVHVSDHHVRVAVGRDYRDVAPTRGTYVGAAGETMKVTVATKVLTPSPSP